MTPSELHRLLIAPEIIVVDLALAALRALDRALLAEHPRLHAPPRPSRLPRPTARSPRPPTRLQTPTRSARLPPPRRRNPRRRRPPRSPLLTLDPRRSRSTLPQGSRRRSAGTIGPSCTSSAARCPADDHRRRGAHRGPRRVRPQLAARARRGRARGATMIPRGVEIFVGVPSRSISGGASTASRASPPIGVGRSARSGALFVFFGKDTTHDQGSLFRRLRPVSFLQAARQRDLSPAFVRRRDAQEHRDRRARPR